MKRTVVPIVKEVHPEHESVNSSFKAREILHMKQRREGWLINIRHERCLCITGLLDCMRARYPMKHSPSWSENTNIKQYI